MMKQRGVQASCVARNGAGILIYGPPGSGKSLLVLGLIEHGFTLVADDYVVLDKHGATAPETIRGQLEVRGVGVLAMEYCANVPIILAVVLGEQGPRLPTPERDPLTGAVLLRMAGGQYEDVLRVKAAFHACTGHYAWVAGAGK